MLRKLLVCAALVCVAFVRAQGQGSEATKPLMPSSVRLGDVRAEAARLLKSDDRKERAWGAYLVGLHELKEQAASLVSIIEDESLRGGGTEESVLRQAALDSLIRLDAEVPAEALLPLYESSPNEVVILLARSPENNGGALLSLFAEEKADVRWLALGNLLARTQARGFAARLLADLKIEGNVYVYDRERDYNTGGGSGHGCGCGCYSNRDESLPPVGYYHLTTEASRGATVVSEGRHNVYYRRALQGAYCGGCSTAFDHDAVRVEYVADVLGTTEEGLGLEAHPFREVICKDAAQCRGALAGVRDEIRRAFSTTVARLLERGLIDAAESAELKPDISLDVTDRRDKKTFPLPGRLKGVKLSFNTDGEVAEPEAPAEADTPPAVEPR